VISDFGFRISDFGNSQFEIRNPTFEILADLHVHTVLSPCAEVEMIPPLIVRRARELGLGLIAITDHNAATNCEAVMRAAEGSGLAVLPGMEVQTSEEVHVVCLFDTLEQALTWQGIVFNHLPDLPNPEETFGAQFVVDANGDYIRTETRLLITSTDLTLNDVVQRVRQLGGLAIPAHVDRPMASLLVNLGFVPPGLDVPALELFRLTKPAEAIAQWPELAHWPLIRAGDAHQLSEITPALRLHINEPTLAELSLAFAHKDGRSFTLVNG
jgi:PHP family Zn ribbon phosphoesterase